jgi:hypothetical protein
VIVRRQLLSALVVCLTISLVRGEPSSQPASGARRPVDERHGIVATNTSGWDGPIVPMQGPRFFDAGGMKWWYDYTPNSGEKKTFKGYQKLHMCWRTTLDRKAEQIRADARAAAAACPGQTIYWAMSNEVNDKGQANQKAADYAKIYLHYHRNLKRGDPDCKIMGPSLLNWDFLSSSVWQRGKEWYEEFRNAWRDTPVCRSYSRKHYSVDYPPQDVFNFHAYDLRGVQGTPFQPEDWRYSRDQILKCYKAIQNYPEVLTKKIWLTEFGALRAKTMKGNIVLTRQLVGWMRDQPFIERWFWFLLHSDKHGNWPKLELLIETAERTPLGDMALELATLPRTVEVDPVNHHYANDAPMAYLRKGWSSSVGIKDIAGDHPRFELIKESELSAKTVQARTITAGPGRRIRKVVFQFTCNYESAKVQLVMDGVSAVGDQALIWKTDRVRSIGVGFIVLQGFKYSHATGEWLGEINNLVLYTEPDADDR